MQQQPATNQTKSKWLTINKYNNNNNNKEEEGEERQTTVNNYYNSNKDKYNNRNKKRNNSVGGVAAIESSKGSYSCFSARGHYARGKFEEFLRRNS